MDKLKVFLVISLMLVFVSACSKNREVMKKPPFKYAGTTLTKAVGKKGGLCVPKGASESFSTSDKEVVALLNLKNISGKHKLRWDWYTPSGTLYHSTNDFPFKTSSKKYVKKATPWHKLSIKDEKAAEHPGKWMVKVFLDDELMDSKSFVLNEFQDSIALSDDIATRPFPKDWGFIIGIEDYAHLPNVEYARKDALIMKDYFMKVFGIPEENIITLIDSDATKSRIEGYIKQYIPANVSKSTTLYVYFAGHGAPDMTKGDPYIVPHDGDTKFIEQTGYRLKQFYNDLNKLKIQRSYVFLDSCFSGVASRAAEMLAKGTRPALLHTKEVKLKTSKIVSLSASSKGQTSNSYEKKQHGLFTYYLLKGISGEADKDDDRWVSIEEIFSYVKQHVTRVSRRIGAEQVPAITPSLTKLKDISISRALK